jgi:hypothetical protein
MTDIVDAIGVLRGGNAAEGRARLLALWGEHSAKGARLQMSVIAHFLADTEPQPADELEWDLRALEAATGSREAEDLDPVSPGIVTFLPSLHGSVANGYRTLGDRERARRHVRIAVARMGSLADDDYGELVRSGLRRLQRALGLSADAA